MTPIERTLRELSDLLAFWKRIQGDQALQNSLEQAVGVDHSAPLGTHEQERRLDEGTAVSGPEVTGFVLDEEVE